VCFSESASRVVVAVDREQLVAVLASAATANIPAAAIGTAGGTRLVAANAFDVDLDAVQHAWRDAIPNLMSASGA